MENTCLSVKIFCAMKHISNVLGFIVFPGGRYAMACGNAQEEQKRNIVIDQYVLDSISVAILLCV